MKSMTPVQILSEAVCVSFVPHPARDDGGARGVMVIVVQILDEIDCISHSTNTLGKGMNPVILPLAMGK